MYTNKHTDSISIGRFKVLPGADVPDVPLTEDEAASLVHFIERGFVVGPEPEPEQLAPEPEPAPEQLAPEPEPEQPEPEVKRRKRKHADS